MLQRLDAYGTDEPDFREGHPEDRCPVCAWAVVEHVGQPGPDWAKWPHRRAAAFALLSEAIERRILRAIVRARWFS
ncbi:hypothetical protein [Mycobacterium sp. NPDC050041]|uniref:hypothetical protein n=1 Tax=Mycobacterium sp. NPDC050041 TaxID=3364293 RepID=UPI003C2C7832